MVDLKGPCMCDGRYADCGHRDPCGQPNSGTGHGPWCAQCNTRRFAAIKASLAELADSLTPSEGAGG